MSKKSTGISEQWLIDKGYTLGPNGAWTPPALKSKFIQSLKEPIVEKREVTHSPDFEFKGITTEWFIKGYQVPSKKNSRITFVNKAGKQMNIPSKRYSEYKQMTKMQWEIFGREFKRSIELLGLQFPLNIEMTFIRKTKQLVDYFGPGESVFDLMTDYGWWPDDNRFYGKPFFGDMQVDKNNPGVIIKILTK